MVCPCCPSGCSNKDCRYIGAAPQGDCNQSPGCCCEIQPKPCYHPVMFDENGEYIISEYITTNGKCENCCPTGQWHFWVTASTTWITDDFPNGELEDNAEAWVAAAREWLEANGWTVTSYSEECIGNLEQTEDGIVGVPEPLIYLRACCDHELLCPETGDGCATVITWADGITTSGLSASWLNVPNPNYPPCPASNNGYACIPACVENPLP